MLMVVVVVFTIIGFIVGCLYLAFCKKDPNEKSSGATPSNNNRNYNPLN